MMRLLFLKKVITGAWVYMYLYVCIFSHSLSAYWYPEELTEEEEFELEARSALVGSGKTQSHLSLDLQCSSLRTVC